MKEWFGVDGSALGCVTDFLSDRSQTVRSGKAKSGDTMLQFGIPQGSVLGPRIFIQNTEDVDELFISTDYITTCLLTTCKATAVAGV